MINNENKQLLSYHSDTFKKEFMETFKIETEEEINQKQCNGISKQLKLR